MIRTLQKQGNSLALVFDEAMMELLGLQADTPLRLTTNGHTLTVTPATVGIDPDELQNEMESLYPRYKKMLEHLAK